LVQLNSSGPTHAAASVPLSCGIRERVLGRKGDVWLRGGRRLAHWQGGDWPSRRVVQSWSLTRMARAARQELGTSSDDMRAHAHFPDTRRVNTPSRTATKAASRPSQQRASIASQGRRRVTLRDSPESTGVLWTRGRRETGFSDWGSVDAPPSLTGRSEQRSSPWFEHREG